MPFKELSFILILCCFKTFVVFKCPPFYEISDILNDSKSRLNATITLRNKELELPYQVHKSLSHTFNFFFFFLLFSES